MPFNLFALVHMHGLPEPRDDSLGAHAAGFLLVRIAPFGHEHLVVFDGHAAAANPVLAVARVNMVVIGQRESPSKGMILPEYQIGCEALFQADKLKFPIKER
jgi:hypothetical protein